MVLIKIVIKLWSLGSSCHTFIARSASSRASLSLSVLIVSLTIERFGDGSAGRAAFGGDFEGFDGDIQSIFPLGSGDRIGSNSTLCDFLC